MKNNQRIDPADIIRIHGKQYSIKKIDRLYKKSEGMEPYMPEGFDFVWFCPACNKFYSLSSYSSVENKYCSKCGQKIKWPRKKKKAVGSVVKKGDSKNV